MLGLLDWFVRGLIDRALAEDLKVWDREGAAHIAACLADTLPAREGNNGSPVAASGDGST